MKLKYYLSTKRCILLGFLFWLLGALICFAGLFQADFKTENLQISGKTPWYQTVHFDADNYTQLGVTFNDGSFVGLGSWNNKIFLTSNFGAHFNGSRIGNESRLVMDFTVLNGNDSQLLTLKKGDRIDADIVIHSGSININIEKKPDSNPPLYRKQDVTAETFSLEVPEDGIYEVSVTGKGAAGKVSFIKQTDTD